MSKPDHHSKHKTTTHTGYECATACHKQPHYTSEVDYHHPHYTSEEHYAPPKYTSEAHYEPPHYTTTKPYNSPKYTSEEHYKPPKYTSSKAYEPPKYTSSKSYQPPKYTSSKNYGPPKYTSSKNYEPPKYTSEEHYEPPMYKTTEPYHPPKYTTSKPYEPPHYTSSKPYHHPAYTSKHSYPAPPKYTSEKPEYNPVPPKYSSENEYGRPPLPTYRPARRSDCAHKSGDSKAVCRVRSIKSHDYCKPKIFYPEQFVQTSHNNTQIRRSSVLPTAPLRTVMQREANNTADAGIDKREHEACIKFICQQRGYGKVQCKTLEKLLETEAKVLYDTKIDYTTDDDVCGSLVASQGDRLLPIPALDDDAWHGEGNLPLARVALMSRASTASTRRGEHVEVVKYCARDLCKAFTLTVDQCNAEMAKAKRFMKEKYNVDVDFSTDEQVCEPKTGSGPANMTNVAL